MINYRMRDVTGLVSPLYIPVVNVLSDHAATYNKSCSYLRRKKALNPSPNIVSYYVFKYSILEKEWTYAQIHKKPYSFGIILSTRLCASLPYGADSPIRLHAAAHAYSRVPLRAYMRLAIRRNSRPYTPSHAQPVFHYAALLCCLGHDVWVGYIRLCGGLPVQPRP